MNRRTWWLPIIGTSLFLTTSTQQTFGGDVLKTSQDLSATKYKDHKYGSSGDKRIDCVQFVLTVVEKLAADEKQSDKITNDVRKTIKIQLLEKDANNLQKLVDANDAKTTGVQKALVDAGLGTKVEPKDAKPGDFVQYWYKEDGKWHGHSGIVEKMVDGKATIYGAHQTTLQTESGLEKSQRQGGIGSGPVFDLTDLKRKVYLVRWKTPG